MYPPDPLLYKEHLDDLRDARRTTETVVGILAPATKNADTVVASTWEIVYDHLAEKSKHSTLDDLNTLSAVIYKLAQSSHHLTTLEHKVLEFEEQRAQQRAAAERARAAVQNQPGLPPELRAQLETDLNLLS